ncbi:lamin tail domain-containing protein [Brachybacterium kimchii]|uniref:Lamin tail domain-containing protein n=1 Tax=Brachybacterium kimchii TaxID=2942909 RepID=A0ABY4N4Z3_9MICO|nr:lamin tail domain-containing protein [Brachybacterium kimchii]UQN28523.1 lamin tail domain-containing protein [Brachybacterium kimchii]
MHLPLLQRARFQDAHIRPLLALLLLLALVAGPLAIAPSADAATKKPLDIVKIVYDPSGRDTWKNGHLNKEYIVLKNTGKKTLSLTGYTLRDNGPQRFRFPKGTKIKPGKTLTIRSGKGKNTSSTLYWGTKSYIWNNTHDTARTYNSKGKKLESCTYKKLTKKATKKYVRTTATTAYC